MKGVLFINGVDAYVAWGVGLCEGALAALLTPAPTKTLVVNESRLLNGKQVLEAPRVVADRDVSLTVFLRAAGYQQFAARLEAFMRVLQAGKVELTTCYQPKVVYRLDYLSITQFSQMRGRLGKFIVKFNEPDPTNRK